MEEIWTASQREVWDPAQLSWDTFDPDSYSWEEREAIAYWWTLLSVFDASAPPVFASAFIKTYELHEEDAVRRCFFSVTQDEQNHEQMCGTGDHQAARLPRPAHVRAQDRARHEARTAQRQVAVLQRRPLLGRLQAGGAEVRRSPWLFSSFLMGEIAAATIFHQMAEGAREPRVPGGVHQHRSRRGPSHGDLHEPDGARLPEARRVRSRPDHQADPGRLPVPVGGSVRAADGLLGPALRLHRGPAPLRGRRRATPGSTVPDVRGQEGELAPGDPQPEGRARQVRHPFPAIPEVGISGKEILDVDMEDIIPVF